MPRPISGGGLRVATLLATILCLPYAPASAVEPTVAGLNDLVVFDPGAQERGLPAVKFTYPAGVEKGDPQDGLLIDIPPAIHVHRYYYSGDKEFQGPIIAGGPTVVVANHPKTGKRMYVDVVLPAGAPRIAHSKHGITYVYPHQRVEVKFQAFPFNTDKAVIKNQHGQGWGRTLHNAHQHVAEHVHEGLANSPMIQSTKEFAGDTSDFLHGIKVGLGGLSARGTDGLITLTEMVPGVIYVKSLAEQEPEKDYSNRIRGAGIHKERHAEPFVPTNR